MPARAFSEAGDRSRCGLAHLHLPIRPEQTRVVSDDFHGLNESVAAGELADTASHEPIDQPRKPSCLMRFRALLWEGKRQENKQEPIYASGPEATFTQIAIWVDGWTNF